MTRIPTAEEAIKKLREKVYGPPPCQHMHLTWMSHVDGFSWRQIGDRGLYCMTCGLEVDQ